VWFFWDGFAPRKNGKLSGFSREEASVQADLTDTSTHTNPSQARACRASAGPHRLATLATKRVKQPRGGSLSAESIFGSTARSRAHAWPTHGLPAASRELI